MSRGIRGTTGKKGTMFGAYVLGPVQTNCYCVFADPGADDEKEIPALVVDPGDHGEELYDALKDKHIRIDKILLTHAHFDHIGGIAGILKRAGGDGIRIPVLCPEPERPLCEDPELNCSASMGGAGETVHPDVLLADGERITMGDLTCEVIYTPGHTAGSSCYYFKEDGVLISGDTLFCTSVGRCDLPTGSSATLARSVKERLFVLPDDTIVLPGHGEETVIGYEKQHNPFL